MRFVAMLTLALLAVGAADAKERYFPPKTGGNLWSDFPSAPYSRHLEAMDEPSLWTTNMRAETYRILWLRSFDAPMVFRLTIVSDGTAILITKKTNGGDDDEPGKLTLTTETAIDGQQTRELLEALKLTNFWRLPTLDPVPAGYDGSRLIVEGKKGTEYHVTDRWNDDFITDWAWRVMKKSGENLKSRD